MRRPLHSAGIILALLFSAGVSAQTESNGLAPPEGSEGEVARLVFEYTNQERNRRGLAPFLPHPSLDALGTYHAEGMRDRNFFSHTDREGLDPEGRRRKLFPRLLGGMGENIAYHYGATPEEVARNLVTGWMNSPPHRRNILAGGFSHMGVGIALGEQVHGVQVFGELTAELVAAPEEPVPFGRTGVTFRFRYLGIRERDELSLFIKFADPRAKYFVDVNKYYIGMGPLIPEWGEDDLFTVSFDADKGRGEYQILLGYDGRFYPGGVDFRVE